MSEFPLPTVEECREFKRLVNAGRVAGGLEPLEFLEFDEASPGEAASCLSATNLFCATSPDAKVWSELVENVEQPVLEAIGSEWGEGLGRAGFYGKGWRIPSGILKVTDPFDALAYRPAMAPALRERLVEAGVVAP